MTDDSQTYNIIFQPSGVRGRVAAGTTIRSAATSLGVEIESICAETATCGKCRVLIEIGTGANIHSAPDHVSPIQTTEADWIARRAESFRARGVDPDRLRLSCQAKVAGDLVVFVPESSRGAKQIIRKAATDRHIDVDPVVRRYYIEMDSPSLRDPTADAERVVEALLAAMETIHGRDAMWLPRRPQDIGFDVEVLRNMSQILRDADWKVSVTVWDGRWVTDIRAGYHETLFGIAIDIGSTSIAVYINDLLSGTVVGTDSTMNPQTAYGDDIMSRMAFEQDHSDGLEVLGASVRDGVAQLISRALHAHNIDAADVHELTVVGNTTMHHLFLGISTRYLSQIPFVPAVGRALDIKARHLGLPANPGANVHVLPIAASFVGADAMAVVIAEEPHRQDDQLLIIDIGTNAELIAGNRHRLICTSTPTGPAFEGAHIEHGMRAAQGAIERIEIDQKTLLARYTLIGEEEWRSDSAASGSGPVRGIAGSGIIDGVAEMFRTGILTPRGRFSPDIDHERIRHTELGWEYVVVRANDTAIGRDVTITLHDVRQIQLAKAALYTAARILLNELGIEKPDKVILAGAFGSHIDKTKAMTLGMIPDCPLDRVYSVGNAAGDGARIALLNRVKRLEAQRVARTIERIELPVDPAFQNEYMAAMNFPHMEHHFDALEGLVPQQSRDPLVDRLRDP